MASSSTASPLPSPNRHVTDNKEDGSSFFSNSLPVSPPLVKDLGGAQLRLAYIADPPLAVLSGSTDLKSNKDSLQEAPPLVPAGGRTVVWYIDMPPGSLSPMHRTVSLDLVVQLEGEVELALSTGETRTLKPGDMTVQRSTLHAWRNPSESKWVRMLAVMTECQPMVVGGQVLNAHFPTP